MKNAEQRIEEKTKQPFMQNHPVLNALDFGDVRDLMESYAADLRQLHEAEWISVEDRLPSVGQRVLVIQNPKTTATKEPLFAMFDGKGFRPPAPTYYANFEIGIGRWVYIIFWMPLPAIPQFRSKEGASNG